MPHEEIKRDDSAVHPEFEVAGLSLSWEGEPIVRDISFSLGQKRCICIVGRSGSGKTTLFHALAGLTVPDSGSITLDGKDITGKPGYVSYMLQKDLLLPQRKVLDNVALPMLVKGVSKMDARERADEYFAEFGLQGTQDKYPSQLSGGMRQRAALLRTYLMDSAVMLLDEPFSALDALTRMDMQQWFLTMTNKLGFSSIMITHDVDEALTLADEILVLGSADGASKLPSTIVGRVQVDIPIEARKDFLLSDDALACKKKVMELLT